MSVRIEDFQGGIHGGFIVRAEKFEAHARVEPAGHLAKGKEWEKCVGLSAYGLLTLTAFGTKAVYGSRWRRFLCWFGIYKPSHFIVVANYIWEPYTPHFRREDR